MTSDFAIAVHALVLLNHRQETLQSEQIADNVCTHPVRVRRVMARLRRAGLVDTKEGANGGYLFLGDPGKLSLQRVAEALKEKPVDVKYRTGDIDMVCAVASGMAEVMDGIYGRMNQACAACLSTITIDSIDQVLFERGNKENGKI